MYIYICIYVYIYISWYKCFGVWGSPPINRVNPQVHIDLHIFIYAHIYLYKYIYISFILSHYAYKTALVGGFPEPTLTGCAESLALITVQGFVDGSFIFWASTNDIFRSFTFKSADPPRSRRCSSENIHLIEDVGMFFGFFGVIAKTWKLELYLITSRWRANERLLDHTDTVANRRFQPFGGSSESQQPIKTSTGEWHVAIFWGKRADLLDD